MLKNMILPASAALAMTAVATSANAGTRVANDLSNCRSGASGSAVLVRVVGLRRNTGRVRVQSYSSGGWLERGEWLHRVDIPVTRSGRNMSVCLPVPRAGTYGIAVRHDQNGNNGTDRGDGGGYSNNPDISFPFNLRPSWRESSFRANSGVTRINIVLNYLQGTSLEPIS